MSRKENQSVRQSLDKKQVLPLIVIGSAVLLWLLKRQNVSVQSLIQPGSVKYIADQFPQNEDQFILSAWDWVSQNVRYAGFGSDIELGNGNVMCQNNCFEPAKTIREQYGNCVATSIALTSLLRTRLPADRVLMAVGDVRRDSKGGGHAWVIAERYNQWYLLESTSPPMGWTTVESVADEYMPFVHFNDTRYYCDSEQCFTKPRVDTSCDCGRVDS